MSRKKRTTEGLTFKLPLAMKTGKYQIGYKKAIKLLHNNETKCLIISSNFPSLYRKELEYYAALSGDVPITIYSGTNNELAKMCDQRNRIGVISILDDGEADLIDEEKFKLGMQAAKIIENKKGILAADESPQSIEKRFTMCGINNTEENRRIYRESLFSTKGIEKMVGGVILHEETFDQRTSSGKLLVDILLENNISVGIKLDKGLQDFKNGEKVTKGLEDLDMRCKNPLFKDAEFAKWRATFLISETTPSKECIEENCAILAEYGEICQKNGLVPILEPEILWDGDYTSERAEEVYKIVLSSLIYHINKRGLYLPGLLVKTGYSTPGKSSKEVVTTTESARLSFNILNSTIPPAIPAIVFLSGGHASEEAISLLDKINNEKSKDSWALSFSYGRALTDPFLSEWVGQEKNVEDGQNAFMKQLTKCYSAITKSLPD